MSKDRRRLAVVTWWSEALCMILTVLYTTFAFLDIRAGGPKWSSATWFNDGFCVWNGPMGMNSHILCFAGDVPLGGALTAYNFKLYRKHGKDALLLAAAISFFGVLHGLGHLAIHHFPVLMIPPETLLGKIGRYVGGFLFLFIGPYAAHCFGISVRSCLAGHVIMSYIFAITPPQFAFGAVQLVLNFWICVPRMLRIGCKASGDIAKRVDDGWPAVSILILMVMPVVFAEMMGCDLFFQAIFGHFIYDVSTIAATILYSFSVWRQLPKKKDEKVTDQCKMLFSEGDQQKKIASGPKTSLMKSASGKSAIRKRAESPGVRAKA